MMCANFWTSHSEEVQFEDPAMRARCGSLRGTCKQLASWTR